MTDDPDIRIANSLMDHRFRKLAIVYLTTEERMQPTLPGVKETVTPTSAGTGITPDSPSIESASQLTVQLNDPIHGFTLQPRGSHPGDAPLCMQCGVQMVRAGSCHACPRCGTTSGGSQ